jgi:plasmid stability protein
MKTKAKENMKQLGVKIPDEVHKALKIRAAEEGKSAAVIVEGLVRKYLVEGKTHEKGDTHD